MKPDSVELATSYLREADRDRYLASLVLPQPAREAIVALNAFAADLASIRQRAREPAAGEIRLQWWIDALGGEGHGEVRQNPIADALLDAIAAYGLPMAPLLRMAEARRFDLYHDPMPDVATFEGYAGETVSALYQLAAMILNGGAPVEEGDAAGHLGVAHALVGHLRAFGYNASQGRIFLPWNVLAANGVSEGDVLAGKTSGELVAALRQLAEMAGQHLERADAAIATLPRALHPAFAPIAIIRQQWRALDLSAPFAGREDLADWRKIAALTWWRLRH